MEIIIIIIYKITLDVPEDPFDPVARFFIQCNNFFTIIAI